MWFVYILRSLSFDKYYIGQTDDVKLRVMRHNRGTERSTAPYKPWEVVGVITKTSRSEAVVLERKLKNLNRRKLLRFIKMHM